MNLDYARDVRTEEEMFKDFIIGKKNEEIVISAFRDHLPLLMTGTKEIYYDINSSDEVGVLKPYEPDVKFFIFCRDGRLKTMNIEVKCTGYPLHKEIFFKASQLKTLLTHKNPYYLVADPDSYFLIKAQLVEDIGQLRTPDAFGGKGFYYIHQDKLKAHAWRMAVELHRK